jgi:hypothetical protein
MKSENVKEIIAKMLGISLGELGEIDNPDYGLEIKVYPNNQPSHTIKYLSISEMVNNLKDV